MKKYSAILVIFLFTLSSCRVFNPTRMLRMGPFPEYSNLDLIRQDVLYKIAPFDKISFIVLPNDGEQLISGSFNQSSNIQLGEKNNVNYLVDFDGTVKLPIFGRTPVVGLTVREVEKMLEEKYSLLYNKPFVVNLSVTNKRVFVFKNGNNSSVVNLLHEKMTMWELIAQTGGVGDAKAHRIKLIRMIDDIPHVFLFDLSRLEGVTNGNIVLQANDIVYITPRNRVSEEIMFALTPYLSLISTFVLIYTLIK